MKTLIVATFALFIALVSFSQEGKPLNSEKNAGSTVSRDTTSYIDTTSNINLDMIFVKGGTFSMGCSLDQGRDCEDDEKPPHQVTLNDYLIGKYEVTQKQWVLIMGKNPSNFAGCDNCPVENVSWNDIQSFIKKLNQLTGKTYRLPTEAQWEYAARGGIKSVSEVSFKYSGSNDINQVAWYFAGKEGKDDKTGRTHFVGQKKPNELGIYDMSGNVWEWCSDWYDKYANAKQTNPKGPAESSYRVFRGGSWNNSAEPCRVFYRHYMIPDSRYYNLGFRLALNPKE